MGNHVPTTAVSVTDAVTPLDPAATQRKRRMLFVVLLAAILLPALVSAVLPNAQAEDTIFVAADTDATGATVQPSTSAAQPSTTGTAPTTTAHTTTTTAKPKSTTTTAKPKSTTTTTPKPKATTPATKAPTATAAPQVATPAPTGSGASPAEAAFLACVRKRESGGNYSVVSSNGLWFGAYQMTRGTWDSTAQRAGRPDLLGVPPNQASPADQDYLALVLYRWQGKAPWGGAC